MTREIKWISDNEEIHFIESMSSQTDRHSMRTQVVTKDMQNTASIVELLILHVTIMLEIGFFVFIFEVEINQGDFVFVVKI